MQSATDLLTENRRARMESVLAGRTPDFTVILENIHDPHNMSACLRSCDAVGIMNVHLLYHGGQKPPSVSNASSSSAGKWLNIIRHDSVAECFAMIRSEGKKIYTTRMSEEAVSLHELDFTVPVALVFGNEHSGVSQDAHELADGNFLIPQIGMIQSLNISVACAVSVYEGFRQRKAAGLYDRPALNKEFIDSQLESWARRDRGL